jgi:hypothetical protein
MLSNTTASTTSRIRRGYRRRSSPCPGSRWAETELRHIRPRKRIWNISRRRSQDCSSGAGTNLPLGPRTSASSARAPQLSAARTPARVRTAVSCRSVAYLTSSARRATAGASFRSRAIPRTRSCVAMPSESSTNVCGWKQSTNIYDFNLIPKACVHLMGESKWH